MQDSTPRSHRLRQLTQQRRRVGTSGAASCSVPAGVPAPALTSQEPQAGSGPRAARAVHLSAVLQQAPQHFDSVKVGSGWWCVGVCAHTLGGTPHAARVSAQHACSYTTWALSLESMRALVLHHTLGRLRRLCCTHARTRMQVVAVERQLTLIDELPRQFQCAEVVYVSKNNLTSLQVRVVACCWRRMLLLCSMHCFCVDACALHHATRHPPAVSMPPAMPATRARAQTCALHAGRAAVWAAAGAVGR